MRADAIWPGGRGMQLHFTKMEGCGNDYIYVNGFAESVPQEEKSALVRRLSDRHFGIGGDGVIFINPSERADFEMEMYNADGSRAEMCGNGIRCVGKYVYDHGMTAGREVFTVESFGKVKTLELTVEGGRMCAARVDMGAPVLDPPQIPAIPSWEWGEEAGASDIEATGSIAVSSWRTGEEPGGTAVRADGGASGATGDGRQQAAVPDITSGVAVSADAGAFGEIESEDVAAWRSLNGNGAQRIMVADPIGVGGRMWAVTCVSMGNPHAVVFPQEQVEEMDLASVGPLFESHPRFPNRINTEFVRVEDRTHITMRVWERGTGETLACGTGACAAVVACVLNGLTERRAAMKLPGGTLTIEWDARTNHVFLTGPAETVFEGEVEI